MESGGICNSLSNPMTKDNGMCSVGWVVGYPIQCWRGVFDQLNNNLWSKHNHVWPAIGILIYAADHDVDDNDDLMNMLRL